MERERDGHGRIGRSFGRSVGRSESDQSPIYSPGSPPCASANGIYSARVGRTERKQIMGGSGIVSFCRAPPRRGRRWFPSRHGFHFAGLELNRYIIYIIVWPFSLSRFSLSSPPPRPPPSAHVIHSYRAHRACVRACPEREKHADDGRAGGARHGSVHVKIKKTTPQQRTRPLPTP